MSKTFKEWYKRFTNNPKADYYTEVNSGELKTGWDACKQEILNILEQNTELESISQNGEKIYKIYGNVVKKIKDEI